MSLKGQRRGRSEGHSLGLRVHWHGGMDDPSCQGRHALSIERGELSGEEKERLDLMGSWGPGPTESTYPGVPRVPGYLVHSSRKWRELCKCTLQSPCTPLSLWSGRQTGSCRMLLVTFQFDIRDARRFRQ